MADTEAVAIGEARNHLAKDSNGFGLRKTSIGDNVVEELTPLHVFKDQVPE